MKLEEEKSWNPRIKFLLTATCVYVDVLLGISQNSFCLFFCDVERFVKIEKVIV